MKPTTAQHAQYVLRLADTHLVLGHRLSEWCGQAPTLEEEMALANIGLDLIGQARALYQHAASLDASGRDEDALAYRRDAHEFTNLLIAEQPNGDFAVTMIRQLLFSSFAAPLWGALGASRDPILAAIAAKAAKEAAYHVRHAGEWVIRLGDGTAESHRRAQAALEELWPFTGEMLEADDLDRQMVAADFAPDPSTLAATWRNTIDPILREATLNCPTGGWMQRGGRQGRHTEHLGHLLASMQFVPRAYPEARW